MKGHLTAYERRFLGTHLFRAVKSQDDREAVFDAMDALEMRDELFTLSMRGALAPLVTFQPPSKEVFEKDPAKAAELAAEFDAKVAGILDDMEADVVPFDLDKPILQTILKAMGKMEELNPMEAVVSARVGRRLRQVIAGDYVPPPLASVKAG